MNGRLIAAFAIWLTVAGLAIRPFYFLSRHLYAALPTFTVASRSLPPILPVPYTIVLEETFRMRDSTSFQGARRLVAVRSDGSRVLRTDYTDSIRAQAKRQLAFPSGLVVITDEVAQLKASRSRPSAAIEDRQRDPRSNCLRSTTGRTVRANETLRGTESILGYSTIKLESSGLAEWFAVELGCASLKRVRTFPEGTDTVLAVSVTAGEPGAELFEIPLFFKDAEWSEVSGGRRIDTGVVQRNK